MSKAKRLLFYHANSDRLHLILPALLQKVIQSGLRILILSADVTRMNLLDKSLWTFSSDAFTPHGTAADPYPEQQPILLTTSLQNLNEASVICFDFPDYASCHKAILSNQDALRSYEIFLFIADLQQQYSQDREDCIQALKQLLGDAKIDCKYYTKNKNGWEEEQPKTA